MYYRKILELKTKILRDKRTKTTEKNCEGFLYEEKKPRPALQRPSDFLYPRAFSKPLLLLLDLF